MTRLIAYQWALLRSFDENVIMTEVKCTVVGLYNKGYLKFHIQYMRDTLLLMKKPDVPIVLQTLNDFIKI